MRFVTSPIDILNSLKEEAGDYSKKDLEYFTGGGGAGLREKLDIKKEIFLLSPFLPAIFLRESCDLHSITVRKTMLYIPSYEGKGSKICPIPFELKS
ncbi:hypothetical protein TNIN_154551 [Trichonephila inaurata madagascariensis]|uniref:Uncharacterized protein n=1 Tax=Trichonephila inaurata madagascariensis TaxID=2747483 RepID=A0A8X6YL62_9ARAC|nr:hypothetical protein TNIN_154551 [Trichonephila inaurata madagascariensis]